MGSCHVAHDCKIGNNNILANNTLMAGHVVIEVSFLYHEAPNFEKLLCCYIFGCLVYSTFPSNNDVLNWILVSRTMFTPLALLLFINFAILARFVSLVEVQWYD